MADAKGIDAQDGLKSDRYAIYQTDTRATLDQELQRQIAEKKKAALKPRLVAALGDRTASGPAAFGRGHHKGGRHGDTTELARPSEAVARHLSGGALHRDHPAATSTST